MSNQTVEPPWDISTIPESMAGIETIRQIVSFWLDYHEMEFARVGLAAKDSDQIRQVATTLTRGQLKNWIAELDKVIERVATSEGKEPRRGDAPTQLM